MSNNGKVVLVTGGGSGIGEATARLLSKSGFRVAVMGRRSHEIEKVAAEIEGIAVTADAANSESVRKAISKIVDLYGSLDAVIHCAGTYDGGGALDFSDLQWKSIIDINLTTAFVTSREALPSLIKSKGAIVIVSSLAGIEAIPESVGYVTTKHALIGLTRSMALDYGPQGVRVNVICPGWTKTEMADHEMVPLMDQHNISLDDAYSLITSDVPLRRAGNPDEIARVCKFLVEDSSSLITGAVIPVDGGSSIVCAAATKM